MKAYPEEYANQQQQNMNNTNGFGQTGFLNAQNFGIGPDKNYIDVNATSKFYYPLDDDMANYNYNIYPNKPINDITNQQFLLLKNQNVPSQFNPGNTGFQNQKPFIQTGTNFNLPSNLNRNQNTLVGSQQAPNFTSFMNPNVNQPNPNLYNGPIYV